MKEPGDYLDWGPWPSDKPLRVEDLLGGLPRREEELSFIEELERLINRHSLENGSNTPDFILAEYLHACLSNFDAVVQRREEWFGRRMPRLSTEAEAKAAMGDGQALTRMREIRR